MDIRHPDEIWLISVLGQFGTDQEWNRLCTATVNLSANVKIEIPRYHLGGQGTYMRLKKLLFSVEVVLAGLVRFATKVDEERCGLWENLSVFNGYRNGCITKFLWNVDKCPPNMTVFQICEIFERQIWRTRKHFKDIWGDYDYSRRAATGTTQNSEREQNPENPPQQRPRRRQRMNVSTGAHQTSLLVNWLRKTFRETFDLFLHVIILKMYVETVGIYRIRGCVIFLLTPLDKPRLEDELDRFYWEFHRLNSRPSTVPPLQDVTDNDKFSRRPYPLSKIDLAFMRHPRFMILRLCPSLWK